MKDERIALKLGQIINGFSIKELIYCSNSTLTYKAEKNSRIYIIKEAFPVDLVATIIRDDSGLLQACDKTLESTLKLNVKGVLEAERDSYIEINEAFVQQYDNNCQYVFPFEIQEVEGSVGSIAVIDTEYGSTLDEWSTFIEINNNNIEESVKNLCDIFIAILSAIKVIHQTGGILHCDLKPNNIYVVENMGVKILDFGSAIKLKSSNHKFDEIKSSSFPFSAPEIAFCEIYSDNIFKIIDMERMIGINSDLYSIGYMFYYLLLRIFGISSDDLRQNYLYNIGNGVFASNVPEYLKAPIMSCLIRALYNESIYKKAIEDGSNSKMFFMQQDPYDEFQNAFKELKDIVDSHGIHPAIILKNAAEYYEKNVALDLSKDRFIPEMLPNLKIIM